MNVTIKGKPFDVAPEPADYWKWIAEGRYDHEWKVYDAHLKPEHTFIDLGAWVGAHSLYASTIAGRVIAVEPDPVAFAILVKNTPVSLGWISKCEGAVTGSIGKIKLGSGLLGASTTRANPNAGSGIGAWDEEQTFTTDCTTIRKFCEDIADPLFIKMDVEGSEEEILKDIAFFEKRKPTLLIELHPFWWKGEEQAWGDFEAVKGLYKNALQVVRNSWLLHD